MNPANTPTSRRNLLLGGLAGAAFAAIPDTAVATTSGRKTTPSNTGGHRTTQIDASDTQILFAHCQEHLVSSSKTTPPETIRRASRALAELAKALSMPLTFAFVPEKTGRAVPIEQLNPYLSSTNQFTRLAATPFLDQPFTDRLAGYQRKNLVITGYATEVVIQKTVHDAIVAGYTVYVPVDAVGGMSERTEQAVFGQIETAGGILTSTWTIIAAIAPDFGNGDGVAAYKIAQTI